MIRGGIGGRIDREPHSQELSLRSQGHWEACQLGLLLAQGTHYVPCHQAGGLLLPPNRGQIQ